MNKQLLAVLGITGTLFLASAGSYLVPARAGGAPARVVLDNTGGRVVFAHAGHAEEYGLECDECHHDEGDPDRPLPCGVCHPAEFGPAWAAGHGAAFEGPEQCLRCHDQDPAQGVAPDARPDASWIPVRADAFHGQCLGCHESMGGPAGEESCNSCHTGM